ncbi:MAG: hypothetical protein GTN80_03035 [Nitrososphaeria archaeon]|nr:hypothetical protein [Nitrososphaeria archaeon]NIN52154.1 hypothetical protein [Nitrososphaeria archaeon]NIQ32607.1 hypothetical protein [Nitrososphaeria archaeon]
MSTNTAQSSSVEAVQRVGGDVVFLDLRLNSGIKPRPGQFVMAYTKGSEEIPLSIMDYEKGILRLGVKSVGHSSKLFVQLKCGDYVSIRGPYGTHFQTHNATNLLLTSYGLGLIPLYFLAKERKKKGLETHGLCLLKENDIVLSKLLEPHVSSVRVIRGDTEEMSYYEEIRNILVDKGFDLVVSCGYKTFVYRVWRACEDAEVPAQLSLERMMKCGMGLCGSCLIDGERGSIRLCTDGPVLSSETLRDLSDFGSFEYNDTGRKVKI